MIFVGGIDAVESYGIRHTTGKIVTFAAQSLSHGLRRDSSLYTRKPLSRFCLQCAKSEFNIALMKINSLNSTLFDSFQAAPVLPGKAAGNWAAG